MGVTYFWRLMMKTSELQGAALDWAVAQCEGLASYIEVVEGFKPSTDWVQGGSIIEREGIAIWIRYDEGWKALMKAYDEDMSGETPLIAAMRCYVTSKLGDEIEIPEGLA
jgi:hypothetical protein